MAGWIKIPLGREVGLDPSNIVLDGDQLPIPLKRGSGVETGGSGGSVNRGPGPRVRPQKLCKKIIGYF